MTPEEIDRINASRLDEWRKALAEVHATPAVFVGIGHDHARGEIHLFTPEPIVADFIRRLLLRAIELIESDEFTKA